MNKIKIIGGGLAGSECAYQLLKRGYAVDLYEMRGVKTTPCHHTDGLAELVCSNSLKSENLDTGSGMLKAELDLLDSLLLRCARQAKVPAGGALAVERTKFSALVESELSKWENLTIIRKEVGEIDLDEPTVVASGPLTSDTLARQIQALCGQEYLHFFDAVAPIISAESIDCASAFFGARYDKGEKDYLNCPMTKEEYLVFWNELVHAQRAQLQDFEVNVFDGCMPIEIMAERGEDTMRFGPLRPVGIRNPDGAKPYAVVQLRKENTEGETYNIVGFQTNLLFGEQKRVFSLIPALKNMEILRYGVMHRNTFINAPQCLNINNSCRKANNIFFAGQMTGVEGYMESVASGLMTAINIDNFLNKKQEWIFPSTTICGQLQRHLTAATADYQPMNSNFGLLAPLEKPARDKKERKMQYAQRGVDDMKDYLRMQDKSNII
ncbi:MAG: methylenetetrahydrofolate--tRNA-(uracil(54)-C(5))-methyltransferase (FADH(2)-oxidizing) TrmFO [Clostridia bacterium]